MFNLFRKHNEQSTQPKRNNNQDELKKRIAELEKEISRKKNSMDYKLVEFDDEVDLVHIPEDTIKALTDYAKSNHRLVKNHLYSLNKQDLEEAIGEGRVFEFEPIPIDFVKKDKCIYVFSNVFAGEIPNDKANNGYDFELYFNGFKYKELITEDFVHYQLDKGEASVITLRYKSVNPNHEKCVKELDNLEKELSSLKASL